MQNLTINPAYVGKTITKDLGYTKQTIQVDKLKPSQYQRVFNMGFKEIFLTDGREEKNTSDEKTQNIRTTIGDVGRVQEVEKKPRKKRTNS